MGGENETAATPPFALMVTITIVRLSAMEAVHEDKMDNRAWTPTRAFPPQALPPYRAPFRDGWHHYKRLYLEPWCAMSPAAKVISEKQRNMSRNKRGGADGIIRS